MLIVWDKDLHHQGTSRGDRRPWRARKLLRCCCNTDPSGGNTAASVGKQICNYKVMLEMWSEQWSKGDEGNGNGVSATIMISDFCFCATRNWVVIHTLACCFLSQKRQKKTQQKARRKQKWHKSPSWFRRFTVARASFPPHSFSRWSKRSRNTDRLRVEDGCTTRRAAGCLFRANC